MCGVVRVGSPSTCVACCVVCWLLVGMCYYGVVCCFDVVCVLLVSCLLFVVVRCVLLFVVRRCRSALVVVLSVD